jgi:hypothetical protein
VNSRRSLVTAALVAALLAIPFSSSLLASPFANGSGRPQFVTSHYATGGDPVGVVIADLDGDGWPDLATADLGTNTVTVLRNDGQGGFASHTSYSVGVGLHPSSLAVGDLDGDGHPDLVVANVDSNTVAVFLADGQGGFENAVNHAAFSTPIAVAIADVDGDGHLDVVVANRQIASISVLHGDGHGGLSLPTSFGVGQAPSSLAMSDFDGDGRPDVVTAGSSSLTVLLNDGHGGFLAPQTIRGASWLAPISVAIGEMNGDEKLDLVVANYNSSSVAVLLGDGGGGFALPASAFAVDRGPHAVAIGDLNGDGELDVAVPSYFESTVSALLGDGQGGFASAPSYPSTFGSPAIAVGDVNGDGKPDIVVADSGSTVSVMINSGTGSPFFEFCYGDGTSARDCPCGNRGRPGRGCDNSNATGGARLAASGTPSLSSDAVRLSASSELPASLSIVLQGRGVVSSVGFGDGLRCAGGLLERLYVEHASNGAFSVPHPGDPSISARSAELGDPIPFGATRAYQVYYRDADLAFCPGGFNASNAVSIAWVVH